VLSHQKRSVDGIITVAAQTEISSSSSSRNNSRQLVIVVVVFTKRFGFSGVTNGGGQRVAVAPGRSKRGVKKLLRQIYFTTSEQKSEYDKV